MANRKNIDENLLFQLHEEGKSSREIAKILGVDKGTVLYRLKYRDTSKKKFDLEKEVLEELYLNQKLSMSEIGRQ